MIKMRLSSLASGEMGGGEGTERGNATEIGAGGDEGRDPRMELEGENGSTGRVLSRESINTHTSYVVHYVLKT